MSVIATQRLRTLRPVEQIAYGIGAALMASGVLHFGVFLVLGGSWEGPVSWRKPTTFGLSFGFTLITVAWITSYLVMRPRTRAWLLGIFAADCVLEVAGITIQAWRRVPSHFNTETPIDTAVAMSLAFGGLVLVITLGAFTAVTLRGRIRGGSDLRLALKAGVVFLIVGLAAGVEMIAKGTTLYRTGHPQEAYTTAGSFKPVHFVALHAIFVLPLVAEVTRLLGWDEARRRRAVVVTGLYVVATLIAVVLSVV